jgi:dehydrogenase/reductase SDR family member 1
VGQLDGKVAVVIGASRGIGKGAAIEAALAGATVYATGRTLSTATSQSAEPGSLTETVAEITAAGGHAIPVRCDATNDADLEHLHARVRSEQGRLDLLVHSAYNTGVIGQTMGRPSWELPTSLWDDIVLAGARAAYISAVHAAPALIATGGGLIVHVSARGAARYRYNAAYGMDKAAIDKLTADLAHELQPHRVAVVSLWPSVTRTERSRPTSGVDEYGYPDPSRPVEELETPRYSGRAVVALASDPEVLARTGRRFWTAELAAAYGFTDEYGRAHPIPAEVPAPGSVSPPAGAATPTRSG